MEQTKLSFWDLCSNRNEAFYPLWYSDVYKVRDKLEAVYKTNYGKVYEIF